MQQTIIHSTRALLLGTGVGGRGMCTDSTQSTKQNWEQQVCVWGGVLGKGKGGGGVLWERKGAMGGVPAQAHTAHT